MSDWMPRPGMDPSPNETRVLFCIITLWAKYNHAYGPTITELHEEILRKYHWPNRDWQPSLSTVRKHVHRLIEKEHVKSWDRRKVGGVMTYEPTTKGRLYIYECLIGYTKRNRQDLQWKERL